MARKMSDEEIEDYTYNKIFGELDEIESGSMFSKKEDAINSAADNAGTPGAEGINITVKPIMAAAAESGKPDDFKGAPEEEKEDKLRGIGKMSPLMERLHGDR